MNYEFDRRRLKLLRETGRYSKRGLAAAAGITESTIRRLEAGQGSPTLDTVIKLAVVLGLSPKIFITKRKGKTCKTGTELKNS